MSTSQCVTDPGLAESAPEGAAELASSSSRLLKGLLIGFGATVAIGLGLTSWYVGSRIVAANAPPPPSLNHLPAKTPQAPPAPVLHPPPPELYLEVAGLGPRRDLSFVQRLDAQGYRARVERAATHDDTRILIGPFAERSSLEEAEHRLQSQGVLAMEAAH
jgi:cell division septation protein DedD